MDETVPSDEVSPEVRDAFPGQVVPDRKKHSYLFLALVATVLGAPLGVWALGFSVLAIMKFQDGEDYVGWSMASFSRFISWTTIVLVALVLILTGLSMPYLTPVVDLFRN